MSVVCVIAPVMVAAWPAFSSAVIAAAGSLGYQVASEASRLTHTVDRSAKPSGVHLEVFGSEIVTTQLQRDQRLAVTRDGVTVTFSRDARGQASLCVVGEGMPEETLRALGTELSQAVVQQYAYQRIIEEMRQRGLQVVEEELLEDRSIHLKVRQWEG
jgi:hypothetical protein